MFPPGPTALSTRPNPTEFDALTVVTGPTEELPPMAPEALATEAATVAQPPSQTDGAEETVAEGTTAEMTVAETTVTEKAPAETTVAKATEAEPMVVIVPVASTAAGKTHLVTDPAVVETAAPATAAEDVKPVQTAATEAEPNNEVVTEKGADEVNGKKCVGWTGK